MTDSFSAGDPGKSLRWAVLIALLIDSPFLLVMLLLGGETMLLPIMIIPTALSALIVYASYTTGRMTYVLGENELRVNFPLAPLAISYSTIRSAGKVETSLRLRLFGGSLPGSHWGLFTTSSIGRAQVYATRYKGEFVLIELTNGDRILISPQEPDALLEALGSKTLFTPPISGAVAEPRLDRKLAYIQIAVVATAWLALALWVVYLYPGLPATIPVHFGLNGVPNRYGSKAELLVLVAVSGLFPSLNAVFALKFGRYSRGLTMFLGVVFLMAVGLFALVVSQILQAI